MTAPVTGFGPPGAKDLDFLPLDFRPCREIPLLRAVRQDQPRGHPGACLGSVPLQQGAPGVDGQDFADVEAYGVQRWLRELALALIRQHLA